MNVERRFGRPAGGLIPRDVSRDSARRTGLDIQDISDTFTEQYPFGARRGPVFSFWLAGGLILETAAMRILQQR